MDTPNGYGQINALFGNPANADGSLNHAWYMANIITVAPPAGWQLYYQNDNSLIPVKGISVHHLLADIFSSVLSQIWSYAVQQNPGATDDDSIRSYLHQLRLDITGGGFNFRPSSGNAAVLSLHSYGIAIDWDPLHNPHKNPITKTLPDWWYGIWSSNGWSDGRHFKTPDPMHVQFATGA